MTALFRKGAQRYLELWDDARTQQVRLITNMPASVKNRETLVDIFKKMGGTLELAIDAPYPVKLVNRHNRAARIRLGVG